MGDNNVDSVLLRKLNELWWLPKNFGWNIRWSGGIKLGFEHVHLARVLKIKYNRSLAFDLAWGVPPDLILGSLVCGLLLILFSILLLHEFIELFLLSRVFRNRTFSNIYFFFVFLEIFNQYNNLRWKVWEDVVIPSIRIAAILSKNPINCSNF